MFNRNTKVLQVHSRKPTLKMNHMFSSTLSPNQSSKKFVKSSLPSVVSPKLLNQSEKKSTPWLLEVLVPLKVLLSVPVLALVVSVALDSVLAAVSVALADSAEQVLVSVPVLNMAQADVTVAAVVIVPERIRAR